MIRLDAATFLLQWATGGLFFLWVTTRHRLVGLGYGWLMRGVFSVIAAGDLVAAAYTHVVVLREVAAAGVVASAAGALVVSVVRRSAGVAAQHADIERKRDRVAAMVGAGAAAVVDDGPGTTHLVMRDEFGREVRDRGPEVVGGHEFPPVLDLVAPLIGLAGVVAAAVDAGGNHVLAVARLVVGALFLGAVTDAMLLGHWYLVQPGLTRKPIGELNTWLLRLWPVEVALLLIPTGMIQAIQGRVSDGWQGNLTWFWVACAVFTGLLAGATRIVLRERFYSAVMAATGMLYLAILTAFGTDLVARMILAP